MLVTREQCPLGRLSAAACLCVALTIGALTAPLSAQPAGAARPSVDDELLLVPFLLEGVRERLLVDGQLLVYNPIADRTVTLTGLSVRMPGAGPSADDVVVFEAEYAAALPGDTEFGAISAVIELLPPELIDRHGDERHFAPVDAPLLSGEAALDALRDVAQRLEDYQAELAAGRAAPFAALDCVLPLHTLFPEDVVPGDTVTLQLVVSWLGHRGTARTTTIPHTVVWLRPAPRMPPGAAEAWVGSTLHSGDLHVHSCHGEALNACAPSGNCGAESLQVSGSFSYAQLKSQFQALGMDWFTATDHSYCINSESEYQTIVAECAALTDGTFVIVPDTEVSSDEVGSQIGSDLGDALCLFGTSANHMGAHGIDNRIHGGSQEFWGFCDGLFTDELNSFLFNIQEVRDDDGYPIVHHATSDTFGWNSFAALDGIEENQMHGVEIWNGPDDQGTGGDVQRWVDWLLAGRVLYGYSGGDTHDAAFDFGANHVQLLATESFDPDGVLSAFGAGRSFVSNGPSLVLEVVLDGASLPMGTLQSLSAGHSPSIVTVRAHYDLTTPATITLYRGRVGDSSESVLCQSGTLSGSGTFECTDVLELGARSWYRAMANDPPFDQVAYTNPVFFLPGGCAHATYGTGLGGANIASLSSSSSPAIGSVINLEMAGFDNSSTVFLVLSLVDVPGGIPFKGGSLLVGAPLLLQLPLPLTSGKFDLALQIPYDENLIGGHVFWQAVAPDPTLPAGFALSNGLDTGICAAFP